MPDLRVDATRRIVAPAHAIFAIVSTPEGHVQIDGSGMLVAAPDNKPVTGVGDTFDIDMDRWPIVPVHLLEGSVEKLEQLVTKS